MDFTGMTRPANAPEPGACIRMERPESGVVLLRLVPPHRKLAVFDEPLLVDLEQALGLVELESGLRGLVLAGRDAYSFAAGADIDAIEAVTDPAVVERLARGVQELFERVSALGRREQHRVRTVAAVGGAVLGGAFELALACGTIVASDDPKTRVGLPETQLGILPGWGGCQRLPRRVGVPAALEAILSGRRYTAKDAKRRGMIERITPPEYLERVAIDIAAGREKPRRKPRGWQGWAIDRNPLATSLIARTAKKKVLAQTKGRYPAPLLAAEITARAPHTAIGQGFADEARAVARLATGPVCKSLLTIFRGSEAAKKLAQEPDGAEPPAPLERAAVIGAGVMGGAIASVLAERGLWTRLSDLSPEALDVALLEHRAEVQKKLKRRRLAKHEALGAIDRLQGTRGTGLARAQIVIEAVAERLEVKRAVFGELAAQLADDAILATNTSSLSVGAIAEGLPRPERVAGLHFFNPVRKMPLVEIVRGPETADGVVRELARLVLRMGKTPVVVKDVAGFLVNRLLGPYLDESLRMFEAGVPGERLDEALEAFGMPMGPLALVDEVGFDIAAHAAESLHAAYGERMSPTGILERVRAEDRLGKKTGRGFYLHGQGPKKGPRRTLCSDLSSFQRNDARDMDTEEIVDRAVLAMLGEAARALEEEVVASAAELDLATVFGTGFPPFTGGLLRWADQRGLAAVVARMEQLAARPDVAARPGGAERFRPTALLRRLAESGGSFEAGLGRSTRVASA